MSEQRVLQRPLAELLRPTRLSDLIGQRHLLDIGKPLQVMFESGKPHSMILWGPPGVGKTTIARLMADGFDCAWLALSAVFSGVKEIRAAIDEAKAYQQKGRHTILFIDEIHRFNKAQQDALLPHTESGLMTLIGATTENPSFEVNAALLSRARVYALHALQEPELYQLLERALSLTLVDKVMAEEAKTWLITLADGDARRLLNSVEQLVAAANSLSVCEIQLAWVQNLLLDTTRRFDKNGDYFYDHISALHKSVRGSHPDAALYWFCRMLDAGVDPRYLSRRIIRMAWEDIGLADPRAMQIANDAAATYERLGSPEGELALAEAVIYLAVAAKSNAAYRAYGQARTFVASDSSREVPLHLRNAPTALMKTMGHGHGYRYAHDEPNGYAAGVHYLPEGMAAPGWYQPVNRGLERKISDKLAFLRKLDEQA